MRGVTGTIRTYNNTIIHDMTSLTTLAIQITYKLFSLFTSSHDFTYSSLFIRWCQLNRYIPTFNFAPGLLRALYIAVKLLTFSWNSSACTRYWVKCRCPELPHAPKFRLIRAGSLLTTVSIKLQNVLVYFLCY